MALNATAFLCECFRLSAAELEDVINQYDIKTLEDLQARTCAGLGCGSCLEKLEKRLNQPAGSRTLLEKSSPVWSNHTEVK